ncbi:MAG: DUF4115 domain-containing protein [Chloroflexi bacterium]|nr:MAG: DUF4115 domain-containing protein [Chloroflexota bacterium]
MAELGELLQQARAYKGVSLREAERATRISRQYLEALESDDFTQLPPAAYARGIVRNYATYLGLDPKTVLSLYEQGSGQPEVKHEVVPAITDLKVRSHWAPNFAIIAFMVVIAAIVFAWMYSAYFQSNQAVPTRTIGIATVTPVATSLLSQVPTVSAQGGGSSTVTPTNPAVQQAASPTAADSVQAATESTPTPELASAADTPTESTDAAGDCTTETIVMGEGSHAFVLWAHADVWVDVTVDDAVLYSDVLLSGCEAVFYGESIIVNSGNADLVQIWIDGVDYGDLGETWDATFVYP